MRQLAELCGVSTMTVSLALRGSKRIREETRDRICEMAQRLGYEANPRIAQLMELIRSKRERTTGITLAYINSLPRRELIQEVPTFRAFFEGAMERAVEIGYKMEEFWARSKGMSDRRLSEVIHSRGIEGVIIGPRWAGDPLVSLDWSALASVVVGDVEFTPMLNRVSSHRFHGVLMLLDELVLRGYTRVAVVIWDIYDRHHDHDTRLAIKHYQLLHPASPLRVIPFLAAEWTPATFASRFRKEKPEVVVSMNSEVLEWIRDMGLRVPEDVGYANLDCPPDSNISGIDQKSHSIGRLATDLVTMLLRTDDRGVPEAPSLTLMEGRLKEGLTLRPRLIAVE